MWPLVCITKPDHFVIMASIGAFVFAEDLLGQALTECGCQNLVICCISGQSTTPCLLEQKIK